MKKLVFIMLLSLSLYGCPPDSQNDYLYVNNGSDHNISYFFEWGACFNMHFPDTSVSICEVPNSFTITKQSKKTIEVPNLPHIYKQQQTDTLCFFIFDTDTIAKYDWNTIRANYKILQRYDLSLQDFKRLKYSITFPPSEAMKEVKMYPPYGNSKSINH